MPIFWVTLHFFPFSAHEQNSSTVLVFEAFSKDTDAICIVTTRIQKSPAKSMPKSPKITTENSLHEDLKFSKLAPANDIS